MKSLLRLLTAAINILLLTGCATVQLNLRVAPDGTGEKEMILAFDRDVLALMSAAGSDPLQEAQAELEQDPSVVITRYEQGVRIGLRAVTPFTGSTQFADDAWSGSFTVKDSLFWRNYQLALDADLNLGGRSISSTALSQVDFGVSVDLPARASAHNGQADQTGRKVNWTLIPGRKEHLTLQARQYHLDRMATAGAALLFVLVLGGFLLFQKRPSAQAATGASE